MVSRTFTYIPQELNSAIVRNPLVVSPHTTVLDAIAQMSCEGTNCVLVAKNHELIGILTKGDVTYLYAQQSCLDRVLISEVLTYPVITLYKSACTDLWAVSQVFQKHRIQHLPILDEQDHIVGILNQDTLNELLMQTILCLKTETQNVPQHPAISFPQSESELTNKQESEQNLQNIYVHGEGHNPDLAVINEVLQQALEELSVEEEELRQQNLQLVSEGLKYYELFEFAPDGYLITDELGVIQLANKAIANQLAITQTFLIGKPLAVFVAPSDHPFLYSQLQQRFFQQPQKYLEIAFQPHQGPSFPAEVTIAPIFDNSDAITGFRWIIRDISDRKQAQAQQYLSEQRYKSLANALPVGIFRTDAQGKGVYHNERWYQIVGLTPENASGMGWQQGLHPEDRSRVAAEWQLSTQEQRPFQLEYRFLRPDEKVTWVYGQASAERDIQGQVIGYAGTLTDISDRKYAETQLEAQNKLLAKIAKDEPLTNILNALIHTVEQSFNGAICSISLLDKYNQLRHQAAVNLSADYIQAIHRLEIGEGIGSCGTAAFRKETVIVSNIAIDPLWKDYSDIALNQGLMACWSSPILGSDGRLLGTFGVYYREVRAPEPFELKMVSQIINIAGIAIEREQSQLALEESKVRWQYALEGAGDGVWDWNIQTNKVFFSQQWKAMLGYENDEFKNHVEEWESRIHPDHKEQCYTDLKKYFNGEKLTYQNEHRLRCKDGTYKWILTRGKVIERTPEGLPLRMIGTHSDISDRKQAEHQLQKLIEGTSATTGEDYFPALVSHMAEVVNVSYALVSELIDDELHVLAFWGNGTLNPTFSFPIAKTPCEQALLKGRYYCEKLVQQEFPVDLDLVTMDAQSYLGIALQDQNGKSIGNLCILDQQTIRTPRRAENLLRVFAARAAAELERKRAIQELERLNQNLEMMVKERTAALQKSEERYRALMDGASDAIFLSTPEGFGIEMNQKAEALLGYSKDEIINLHRFQIHPPDMLETIQNYFKSVVLLKQGPTIESIVLRKDGRQIPVDISASRIDLEDEQIVQGIFRDISDRKQVEAELAQSRQKYYSLIQSVNGVVWEYDLRSHKFVFVSNKAQELLGYSLENWLTEPHFWANHVYAEDIAEAEKQFDDAMRNKRSCEVEYRMVAADGSLVWVYDISSFTIDEDGKTLFSSGVLLDIRDRKRLENAQNQLLNTLEQTNAELLRATRLKDEFVANMSHELRTPLNVILGMSECLQEQLLGPINERQKKSISTIERSGTHLLELINDILDVAKIEAGQIELNYSSTSIQTLCQSSLGFIKQQACQKRIQLNLKLQLNLPNLLVDERRIRQVLINLLNNAVKFTPANGSITLEARQLSSPEKYPNSLPQELFRIAVIDTGIGIAPENINKLFQPFMQIDSALNRQYTGTGLGLALVKRIVEIHGGKVHLSSELNVGSCFMIDLPFMPVEQD